MTAHYPSEQPERPMEVRIVQSHIDRYHGGKGKIIRARDPKLGDVAYCATCWRP